MPKVLLTIDHTHIVLPNDTGVATILKALSKGASVWDHRYHDDAHIELRAPVKVQCEYLPPKTKFKTEPDQEDQRVLRLKS